MDEPAHQGTRHRRGESASGVRELQEVLADGSMRRPGRPGATAPHIRRFVASGGGMRAPWAARIRYRKTGLR